MRILFTFVGGNGHFEPLVPVARAAETSGHTIAFAGRHALVAAVEAAGFTMFAMGAPEHGISERIPLRPLDAQREDRDLRDGFADRLARRRAAEIIALCAEWQPDLLVCDEVDFGCMIAAERLGLPYATVLVIAAGSFLRRELIAEPLNRLRAEHGLPADPELAMLSRYLVLSPVPLSYRDPDFPLPNTAHAFHAPARDTARPATAPAWVAQLSGAPTVYFTLGTVFNTESGDLFARVLAGLSDLPINVVATVGHDIDPAEFGPQPGNIHIEQYISQPLILPLCAAVVSHGGSGSVLGALAHGLPAVLFPMGADQPLNAARCAALGVARVLDAVEAKPESVHEAVSAVLFDPAYRQAAEHLRKDIAALPGPAHAVMLLERLVAEQQPIYAA